MRAKTIILLGVVAIFLGGCFPFPSYTVDSYVGSLDRCLNIEGTYEPQSYYRNYPGGDSVLLGYFMSGQRYVVETRRKIDYSRKTTKEDKTGDKKSWYTFRFIDNQRMEITVFSEDGQAYIRVVDMQRDVESRWNEDEEFTCNQNSWQWTYSSVSYGGAGSKWRRYAKTTKLQDGALRVETKTDMHAGIYGGYRNQMSDGSIVGGVGYFRKVDLTLDDIRAMNDKAKRAIEQYDQLATSPPPEKE